MIQTPYGTVRAQLGTNRLCGETTLHANFSLDGRTIGDADIEHSMCGILYMVSYYPIAFLGTPRHTGLGTYAFIELCDELTTRFEDESLLLDWCTPSKPARSLLYEKLRVPTRKLTLHDWKEYARTYMSRRVAQSNSDIGSADLPEYVHRPQMHSIRSNPDLRHTPHHRCDY